MTEYYHIVHFKEHKKGGQVQFEHSSPKKGEKSMS